MELVKFKSIRLSIVIIFSFFCDSCFDLPFFDSDEYSYYTSNKVTEKTLVENDKLRIYLYYPFDFYGAETSENKPYFREWRNKLITYFEIGGGSETYITEILDFKIEIFNKKGHLVGNEGIFYYPVGKKFDIKKIFKDEQEVLALNPVIPTRKYKDIFMTIYLYYSFPNSKDYSKIKYSIKIKQGDEIFEYLFVDNVVYHDK